MSRVHLDGIELFYADDGDGPPIVWLQGLGADHAAWTAQVFAFQTTYRCIRPDNRGVGATQDNGEFFTTADCARDTVRLLDHLGIERAHIVGLSLGGAIAQAVAIDFPERVARLVLAGTFARRDPWSDFLLQAWADLHGLIGPEEFFRQALPWLVTGDTLAREQRVRALLNYAARHPQRSEDFRRQVDAALRHDRLGDLGRITAPTLVMRGAADLLSPPESLAEIVAAIPQAQAASIPEAGHLVNLEQQHGFNEALRGFLA